MTKREIVAKLEEVINSGNLNERDKNELIQVKNEIKNIAYLSEALNLIVSAFIRIFGTDFDFFQ